MYRNGFLLLTGHTFFDENLCYRTYVSDVLEFKNTAGIFVPGTNPNAKLEVQVSLYRSPDINKSS